MTEYHPMLEDFEFVAAWAVYLLAMCGVLAVWWRITRNLRWQFLKQILRMVVAAVLLVPAPVAVDMKDLAPAVFVLLFDYTLVKDGDPLRAVIYLIYSLGLGTIVLLLDALLRQLMFRRSPPAGETAT